MVDKIDKPEAPPPYAITSTTETKRDKPQDQKGQEDLPTFQKESPSLFKEKFQEGFGVLKTIRVPLAEIEKLLFRRATPRHGTPTAEADLVLKNGKIVERVSFLLQNWQDFLKIKNLKIGEMIPNTLWHYASTHLEVTIWQPPTSGPWNLREMQKQTGASLIPLQNKTWWSKTMAGIRLQPWVLAFYALGIFGLVVIIFFLATRT